MITHAELLRAISRRPSRPGDVVDLAGVAYAELMRDCVTGRISWSRFRREVLRRDQFCRAQLDGDCGRDAA